MVLTVSGDADEARTVAMRSPLFTPEQVRYLGSLPAVRSVGAYRLRYADGFAAACLRRYLNGADPTTLFRKAGLDPELVGRKRIERCFARWRSNAAGVLEHAQEGDGSYFVHGDPMERAGEGGVRWNVHRAGSDSRVNREAGERLGVTSVEERWTVPGHMRDRLLEELVSYIDRLERENAALRSRLSAEASTVRDGVPDCENLTGGGIGDIPSHER